LTAFQPIEDKIMPDVNRIYQSQFLRAEQLGGQPRRVTIESAAVEVVGQGEKATQKIVLKLVKAKQRLPLNKVNALMLSSLFGPMTENWAGKAIELRPERVLFSGQMVPAIRVYAAPAAVPVATPAPSVPPSASDAWETEAAAGDGELADDLPWQA
jgi:hypothetical protein